MVIRDMFKGEESTREAPSFVRLSTVFNSASNLQLEKELGPECFVLFLVILGHNLL